MTTDKPNIIERAVTFVVCGALVVFGMSCAWSSFYQPAIMFYSWLFEVGG